MTCADNAASQNGGAIWSSGNLTLVDTTISGNTAGQNGGGVYAFEFGSFTMQGSTVSGNQCSGSSGRNGAGGGIWMDTGAGCNAILQGSTISGNSAGAGGGLYLFSGGTTTIEDCTVAGNTAVNYGGGIRTWGVAAGETIIQGSTISGNSAERGGGLWLDTEFPSNPTATTICQDDTVTGNTAKGYGGGIYADNVYGSTTIQNCTITQNTANTSRKALHSCGGGLYDDGRTNTSNPLIVISTIIAQNTDDGAASPAPDFCGPGPFNFTYSLIDDNTGSKLTEAPVGAPDSNGNLIGGPSNGVIDPELRPLAQNGGPTETCALLAGSPAIDAGSNPGNLPYDQRGPGYPRIVGPQADIGAFESGDGQRDVDRSDVGTGNGRHDGHHSGQLLYRRHGGQFRRHGRHQLYRRFRHRDHSHQSGGHRHGRRDRHHAQRHYPDLDRRSIHLWHAAHRHHPGGQARHQL